MTLHLNDEDRAERRRVLRAAVSAASFLIAGCASTARGAHAPDGESKEHDEHEHEKNEAEVTPGEDLMQEHGVLERILLIYDEAARRIQESEPFDVAVIGSAANIVRRFVEEYHERSEEQFVFPRLEAAQREVELVAVLRRQHERGRALTKELIRLASAGKAEPRLAEILRAFERMYRPHAAREDTVLFPAFRSVIGGSEYRELGEQFEQREHQQFGEHGFDDTVAEVQRLEQSLGIADLARFTP